MNADRMIQARLFELMDEKYRSFQQSLIPTVGVQRIVGVRTPALRKLATELFGTAEAEEFLTILPHEYYDENNLHAFLIEKISDYDRCIEAIDAFLPYLDNWATCDMLSPKVFKKRPKGLADKAEEWMGANRTYTIRFGIGVLMAHYLDEGFDQKYPLSVISVKSDEYYVNMMRAWYFATALAKRYDLVIEYIEGKSLDRWTHNKSIQKAIESYRVTDEHKAYLRTLKI